MSKLFGDDTLTVPCGGCGRESEVKIALLETSPTIKCAECGVDTRYDATELKAGLDEVDKGIAELTQAFKSFGR